MPRRSARARASWWIRRLWTNPGSRASATRSSRTAGISPHSSGLRRQESAARPRSRCRSLFPAGRTGSPAVRSQRDQVRGQAQVIDEAQDPAQTPVEPHGPQVDPRHRRSRRPGRGPPTTSETSLPGGDAEDGGDDVCVIGTGFTGLTVCRALARRGIAYRCGPLQPRGWACGTCLTSPRGQPHPRLRLAPAEHVTRPNRVHGVPMPSDYPDLARWRPTWARSAQVTESTRGRS